MKSSKTSVPRSLTTRREFLGRAMVGLAVVSTGGLAVACGGDEEPAAALDCSNPPGLTDAERATRQSLNYVDQTQNAQQACVTCNFYTPAAAGQCGGCTLGIGPVNPAGYCNSWAARAS